MADIDCVIMEAPETPSEEPQPTNLIEDDNENRSKTNLEGKTLDDDTKEKLKGDQIGDTMYNQSFVLKTLMRFSNLTEIESQWCEEVENDVCFLWDMTVEEDVCKFLFELDFPSIACGILQAEVNHRLIEIIIGILGNICIPKSSPNLNPEQLTIVLHQIDTDDHLILVQMMRFIKINTYKSDQSINCIINTEIMEKIVFILYNSINVGLLEAALDAVAKLTDDRKLYIDFLHENLLEASFTAFKVIYDAENDSDTSEPYKTDVVKRNINHLLQILVNLSVYCNDSSDEANIIAIRRKVDEHQNVIFNEFLEILKSYVDEYDVTDDIAFVFQSIDYIFPVFNLKHDKLTIVLIRLTEVVKKGCAQETVESFLGLCKGFINNLTLDDAFFDCVRDECSNNEDMEKFKQGLLLLNLNYLDGDYETEISKKIEKLMLCCDESK